MLEETTVEPLVNKRGEELKFKYPGGARAKKRRMSSKEAWGECGQARSTSGSIPSHRTLGTAPLPVLGEARALGSGTGSPGCRQGVGGKLTKKPPSSLPQERRGSLWQRQPCRQGTPLPAGQPKLVRLEAATGRPGSPALLLPAMPAPAARNMAVGRGLFRVGAKGHPSTLHRAGRKV